MTTTANLLNALKDVFRARGITYRQAATSLGLSEISIKRIFSRKDCTLGRFEKLCELAGSDIDELMSIIESKQQRVTQLTHEQEKLLVSDVRLLLVAVCIINHWSFNEILEKYDFSTAELTGLFTTLDKIGVIELLPGNRYHLKIARQFRWQPGGHIQRFFVESILQGYLKGTADAVSDQPRFVWGMISRESVDELNRKINRLIEDYLQIAQQDARIPVTKKMTSSLLVMFREDWEPDMFKAQWRMFSD